MSAVTQATPLRVAVVGAGLAGLSAAHALARRARERERPLTLTVLEAGDEPGGQLGSVREDGFLVEWAANAFRTGAGPTADLIERLGLTGEQVVADPAAAHRHVLHGGRLHALPRGPLGLLRFAPLSLAGRWRVLAEPFTATRVTCEESVYDYAARHLGREAAAVLLGTLVRGVYGGDVRALSVDAAFPVMREMERDHRSLVIAAVAGGRRRRREGKRTWSFRGGMGTLIERLADELGSDLHLGTRVCSLQLGAGGGYRLRTSVGEVSADAVVLAVPPHVAAPWLGAIDTTLADEVAGIEAADLGVAALAFARDAFVRVPDGYGFLTAPGEPVPVLGVLHESNVFPDRAPAGHLLLRAILGGVADPEVARRTDDELVAGATDLLDRAYGLRAAPVRAWVRRVPKGIPQYHLGHRERVARIEARLARHPGLQVAGSAYRGISVGSLVADAEVVAARLVDRTPAPRAAAA